MEPYVRKFLFFFFITFTVIVIFLESETYWGDLNVLHTLIYSDETFLAVNFICLIPLGYICAASNLGMFSIKVYSVYEVHGNQTTDPGSLVYSAMLLTKLAVSVAYNFL
jgi:hypothetical protein